MVRVEIDEDDICACVCVHLLVTCALLSLRKKTEGMQNNNKQGIDLVQNFF